MRGNKDAEEAKEDRVIDVETRYGTRRRRRSRAEHVQ